MKKKIFKGILPFLLLFLAMTFMTKFKQWEDLTDMERYAINDLVEAADEPIAANEKKPETNIANSNVDVDDDEQPADPNTEYAITSDDETVWVHGNGDIVFETSIQDWEENWDYYHEKYRLGS